MLLEREGTLDELGRLLAAAAGGRGSLLLLGGEAGVGKSVLVRRFAELAAERARVLVGACDPLSTPRPLGPLADVAGGLGGRVGRLLRGGERSELFRALLDELAGPAATLLVVEDAHWADEATLDLLRFLGRRVGATAALVVATYRDDEVGRDHPLRVALGDLATAPSIRRIGLAPLSAAAVARLAAGSGLDPEELHRQTGGNPFFVTEVLAAGGAIPATVRDAVLARAARLSDDARAALDAAAVVGPRVEPWVLDGVLAAGPGRGEGGLAPDDATVVRAVDECVAAGMLRTDGQALAFRHELARRALLEAIAPGRRRALHGAVLSRLIDRGEPGGDPAQLAHHAEGAGDGRAVLRWAPVAARRAAALGAHREASAQYARALRFGEALPPGERADLLEHRAYESYLTDNPEAAIGACQEALAIRRQLGDRLREGDALRWLSRIYWFAGQNVEAEAAGRAALAVLEGLPPGIELGWAYSNQAQLRMLADDGREALSWGTRAMALAARLGDEALLVHALNNVGMAKLKGDDESGWADLERSLAIAAAAGLEEHVARAYTNRASHAARRFDLARAERYADQAIAYCAEHDLDSWRWYVTGWRAVVLLRRGRWAEAAEEAAAVLAVRDGLAVTRIKALVVLGRLRARRGDPEVWPPLDEALELANRTGELQRLGPARTARAEAAWLAGDHARCAAEAGTLLEQALAKSDGWLAGELAVWLRRAGELADAPGRLAAPFAQQVQGAWREAAATWRSLGCPFETALALLDGDDAALRAALESFEALGARQAAAIAKARLRARGAGQIPRGPRPSTLAHPDGLTARQDEVLRLLGEGLTNAEIASRLVLSPKTVDHHVSAVLVKLGARSRREAVRLAAPQHGELATPT